MGDVFGDLYAEAYDRIYATKDYAAECDQVLRVAEQQLDSAPRRILDLGCGTGGHAIELARRGLTVTGVDLAPAMLRLAEEKAREAGVAPTFVEGDVRTVRLDEQFDVSLMMFAILGYQPTNEDVIAALRTTAVHTRPGGLVLFDVWYGPAVLAVRPSERVKTIRDEGRTIVRTASTDLDTSRHSALVRYRLWVMPDDSPAVESSEEHRMRFFFPLELELFLETAGLELIRIGDVDAFERDPDDETWNVLVAARVPAR